MKNIKENKRMEYFETERLILRESNTKLDYSVANNTHESTATSLPDETGILPDHYITQRIDQYLNKVDAVKDFTVKLAKTHMKQ